MWGMDGGTEKSWLLMTTAGTEVSRLHSRARRWLAPLTEVK